METTNLKASSFSNMKLLKLSFVLVIFSISPPYVSSAKAFPSAHKNMLHANSNHQQQHELSQRHNIYRYYPENDDIEVLLPYNKQFYEDDSASQDIWSQFRKPSATYAKNGNKNRINIAEVLNAIKEQRDILPKKIMSMNKRGCVTRNSVCDHRPNDCCFNTSCRCNLWGSNCRCQLISKIG